jgi:hypothetical protein
MTNEERIETAKRLRDYWYEIARDKTKEAGKAIRKANQLEREVYEMENKKEKVNGQQ